MSIDWTKSIETVDGNPARVLSTDHRYGDRTLVITQTEYSDFSAIGYYHQDGKSELGSVRIRNRKTKREGWINIHRHDRTGEAIYKTKEEAEGSAVRKITTIKIEWEE